jgi:nitrous oxidase accessory protein NosD
MIGHCNFSDMVINASGIYFENSRDLKIYRNNIQLIKGFGIFAPSSRASQFNYNVINTGSTTAAISCDYSDSSQINYNDLKGEPFSGISGYRLNFSEIIGNSLEVKERGIDVQFGSDIQIMENSISKYSKYGIYLIGTNNAYVYSNRIKADTNSQGIYAIYNYDVNNKSVIRKNNIISDQVYSINDLITVYNSIIDSNNISVDCNYYYLMSPLKKGRD